MCLKSTIVKEISVNRGLLGGGSGRIYCTYSVAHMIVIGLIRHHLCARYLVFFFQKSLVVVADCCLAQCGHESMIEH